MAREYPKAGPVGARLIREVIALLKTQQMGLPISSHILIGISGGADSVALAHIIIHLGRRVGARDKISLLHVNHGWRGADSDADEDFVRGLAKKWRVPIELHRLKKAKTKGESWEEEARECRKRIFAEAASRSGGLVLTAHHADDLAETVLWRILTGQARTHGGGIAVRHGVELRPLLRVRKERLKAYLKETGQPWSEDSTNQERRFLRARMRQELLPAIEGIFPRAVEHLVQLGIEAQGRAANEREVEGHLQSLVAAAGLKLRRSHWELLAQVKHGGEVHLPGGWKLIKQRGSGQRSEKWVLERV